MNRTSEDDPRVGRVIDGRYRLEAVLGRGGMGTVYRAAALDGSGAVAIKLLHAGRVDDEGALRRFRAEARHGGALAHPNTVRVLGSGVDEGTPYLVMECLEGASLAEVLAREGRLPAARAADIARQVLESLAEAHGRGIVHRDVKPSNLMIGTGPDGGDRVTVLDFGIARAVDGSGAGTAGFVGTAAYTAPEQWRNEAVDGRTDLYSVGCVLFEMLSGEPPFPATDVHAAMYLHLEAPVRIPPGRLPAETPADLVALLLDLLAKRPDDRPPSAAAALDRLARVRPAPVLGPAGRENGDGSRFPGDTRTHEDGDGPRFPENGDRRPFFRGRRRAIGWAVAAALVAAAGLAVGVLRGPATDAGKAGDVPAAAPPLPVCVLAPAGNGDAAGRAELAAIETLLRDAGFGTGCRGDYRRDALRNAYAARSGMVQHDGTVDAAQVERLRAALEGRFPDIATRRSDPAERQGALEVLLPDPAPAARATDPEGPATVCVLGPSGDLLMAGPWRDVTAPARADLQQAGFAVDCELPYLRNAPRLQGASATGLVQHDGTRPEALRDLLARLRPRYPGIRATVETRRLFRQFDVLLPDPR